MHLVGCGVPLLGLIVSVCFIVSSSADIDSDSFLSSSSVEIRELNCSVKKESSNSEFPDDIFTDYQRKHGAILFHILVALYCFIIIAIVCNDYFLPSVECICKDLNLTEDVAGATFMSIATSAPELFVNVIGTFLTESDLGVGTVVGSAVFNTLGVAACGGLAASTAIPLEVYPLARDCVIYITVVTLLTGILWDDKVFWYEAMILLILYVLYFIFMFSEKRIIAVLKKVFPLTKTSTLRKTGVSSSCESLHLETAEIGTFNEKDSTLVYGTYTPRYGTCDSVIPTIDGDLQQKKQDLEKQKPTDTIHQYPPQQEEKVRIDPVCKPPDCGLVFWWWLFTRPVSSILWLTIPDCRLYRKLYPITFCMCVVWIGICSYVVSWMMTICGETFKVSDAVMGITLLAIGGSMPEACSSVINARKGIGSMSISNALGANTLDILLCLGMPWLIKTLLPARMHGGPITIDSPGLVYNNALQILCVMVLYLSAASNRYKLNRTLGFVCVIMYTLFIVFIILNELNVFKLLPVNQECPS
ncbi:sodium/potassium/calcium exchanger 4 isoform X1 [Nilaparvata lugens]|uniref:sodium/potassium/calcium exchanger 4 isoform X1 n=1 Tax=Nilaparvata lugens TaxID=108931 RepID=UPI000B986548|nr:sodium/potassium/calcium exchanger 4 isoform X1 [Nilaparvata lugens]